MPLKACVKEREIQVFGAKPKKVWILKKLNNTLIYMRRALVYLISKTENNKKNTTNTSLRKQS